MFSARVSSTQRCYFGSVYLPFELRQKFYFAVDQCTASFDKIIYPRNFAKLIAHLIRIVTHISMIL